MVHEYRVIGNESGNIFRVQRNDLGMWNYVIENSGTIEFNCYGLAVDWIERRQMREQWFSENWYVYGSKGRYAEPIKR